MAFSSCRALRCVVVLSLSLLCVRAIPSVSVNCGVCEKSRCPELHYCEGEAVKDHCGCCTVCSSSKYQPHPLNFRHNIRLSSGDNEGAGRGGNACAKVKCPKFKVCMENMQGLPLCTCPGPFICKQRRSRQRPVCGTDGVTYVSRCYLRIAACNSASRIKVARRGPCNGAEGPRPRACDSVKSCRRRKNQHPVCGTDGKTYQSRCHMKITACQRGVKIKLKHHRPCVVSPVPERAQTTPVPTKAVWGRKEQRRRKKKGGSDVTRPEEGSRKRRKHRREKRKRLQRRRKRRKTRGHSRPRRNKQNKRQVLRNLGHFDWKRISEGKGKRKQVS